MHWFRPGKMLLPRRETVHDYRGKRPDLADTLAGACRPQPEIEALELLIGELVEVFSYLLQL